MAVPPTYADLGKSARDVFTKGYGESLSVSGGDWEGGKEGGAPRHPSDFTCNSWGGLGQAAVRSLLSGREK